MGFPFEEGEEPPAPEASMFSPGDLVNVVNGDYPLPGIVTGIQIDVDADNIDVVVKLEDGSFTIVNEEGVNSIA